MIFWLAVYFHAAIGGVVTASFVWAMASETIRAVRQAGRIAAVSVRVSSRRRSITFREWWFAFRREFMSGYDTLRIGMFEVPHNPSKPIRPIWFG